MSPSRKRRREKDSTKITTCTTRSPKRQFETSLAYQGNKDTERERERHGIFDIERERGQGRFETQISFAVCYEREIHARERSHHCLQGKIRETSEIVVFVGRISRKDFE